MTPSLSSRRETVAFCTLILLLNIAASVTYAALSVELATIGESVSANVFLLPDAYVIAVLCAIPLTPHLLAAWGPRRLFTTSMCGLMVTSGLASLTHGGMAMGSALFVHGFFAAPILPATQMLCGTRFDDSESQRRMLSFWMAANIGGILLGYSGGGWLADHISWRLGFFICWIPALLALGFIPRVLERRVASRNTSRPSFDGISAFLLAAIMLSLSGLLIFGSHLGWRSSSVRQLMVIITAALIWFALRYRAASNPLLDLSVVGDRWLAGALLAAFLLNACSTGVFQTEMLGTVIHMDPEVLALRAAMGGVAMLAAVAAADRLLAWTRPLTSVLLAALVLACGKGGFLTYRTGVSLLGVMWPALLASFGYGMMSTMLAVIACHFTDARRSAAAASLYAVAVQLGTSVGLAGLDAVLEVRKEKLLLLASHLDPVERAFHDIFYVELAAAVLIIPLITYYFSRPWPLEDETPAL